MLLFTQHGFFEITSHDRVNLMVRARFHEDIARMFGTKALDAKTQTSTTFDYPYYAVISRQAVEEAITDSLIALGYKDFEGAVEKASGHERRELYERVWAVMALGAEKLDGWRGSAFDGLRKYASMLHISPLPGRQEPKRSKTNPSVNESA